MTVHKVAVGFYTGEYTNALLGEAFRANHHMFIRTIHREQFEDGYAAAGGSEDVMTTATAWGRYVQQAVEGYAAELDLAGLDAYQDVIFLSGEQRHLLHVARQFALLLDRDAREDNIGADDGTYDYFPDAVEALYQLCRGINARWTYVSAVMHIEATEKYRDLVSDQEVTFPTWPKEEVKV